MNSIQDKKLQLVLVDEKNIPSGMGDKTLFLNGYPVAVHSVLGDEIYNLAQNLSKSNDCKLINYTAELKGFALHLAKQDNSQHIFDDINERLSENESALAEKLDEYFFKDYTKTQMFEYVKAELTKSLVIGKTVFEGKNGWECKNCDAEWSFAMSEDQVPETCPHCIPKWSELNVTVHFSQAQESVHVWETTMSEITLPKLIDYAFLSDMATDYENLEYIVLVSTTDESELVACRGEIHKSMFDNIG